jgi:hypothetical protein
MDPNNQNPSTGGGTGTATAPESTELRLAVDVNNQEKVILGTWTAPPPGYRFAHGNEIRDLLETLPAPVLREKIFAACTGNQAY